MIFATHSEYLKNRVFEIIEDLKTEASITGESITLIESASVDKFDAVHSLHEMGYIAKLRRFYDKWNAGEDAVYYLRRLLSYVLSKNPDCKKDVKKSIHERRRSA